MRVSINHTRRQTHRYAIAPIGSGSKKRDAVVSNVSGR